MQRSAAGAEMLCIIPLLLLFVCNFPVVVVVAAVAADGMFGQKYLRLFAQLTELVLVSWPSTGVSLSFNSPFFFHLFSALRCMVSASFGFRQMTQMQAVAGSCRQQQRQQWQGTTKLQLIFCKSCHFDR